LLVSTVFFALMIVAAMMQCREAYVKEGMTPFLEIPTYPFYAIFALGALMILLVFITEILTFSDNE